MHNKVAIAIIVSKIWAFTVVLLLLLLLLLLELDSDSDHEDLKLDLNSEFVVTLLHHWC